MKDSYTIFYSWQSTIGKENNQKYIRDAIKRFILKNKNKYNLTLDEATKYRTGSPNIESIIIEKIGLTDIFICDLSIVAHDEKGNGLPNSNVLFELGVAVSLLGWDRIICVINTFYGEPDSLPFDINHHRFLCYCKNGEEIKKPLSLKEGLGKILLKYDEIVEQFYKNEWRKHDKELFERFLKECPEKGFINSLENCKISSVFDGYDDYLWSKLIGFQNYPMNTFLNQKLNDSFKVLAENTSKMQTDFYTIFKTVDDNWEIKEPDKEYTEEEKLRILHTQKRKLREPIFPEDSLVDSLKNYYQLLENRMATINQECNNVLECYKTFRECVKQELFV
jgi:hypothetical protein